MSTSPLSATQQVRTTVGLLETILVALPLDQLLPAQVGAPIVATMFIKHIRAATCIRLRLHVPKHYVAFGEDPTLDVDCTLHAEQQVTIGRQSKSLAYHPQSAESCNEAARAPDQPVPLRGMMKPQMSKARNLSLRHQNEKDWVTLLYGGPLRVTWPFHDRWRCRLQHDLATPWPERVHASFGSGY